MPAPCGMEDLPPAAGLDESASRELIDLRIIFACLIEERIQLKIARQIGRTQFDGPRAGAIDHPNARASDFFDPPRKLIRSPDGCGKQKHTYSRRRQDDRLFPNVAAVLVGEVVGFVENDEIGADLLTVSKRIEKLITIDLGRSHDQGRICVLFAIARENSHVVGTEHPRKFNVLGVG